MNPHPSMEDVARAIYIAWTKDERWQRMDLAEIAKGRPLAYFWAEIAASAIRTLIDATPAVQSAWRTDMENAPKDRSILVVDRGEVSEAYYDGETDSWWLAHTAPYDFDNTKAIYPTHWQLMPATPSPAEMKERENG